MRYWKSPPPCHPPPPPPPPEPCSPPTLKSFEPYDLPHAYEIRPVDGYDAGHRTALPASHFGYALQPTCHHLLAPQYQNPFSPPQVRPPGASASTYPRQYKQHQIDQWDHLQPRPRHRCHRSCRHCKPGWRVPAPHHHPPTPTHPQSHVRRSYSRYSSPMTSPARISSALSMVMPLATATASSASSFDAYTTLTHPHPPPRHHA